MGQLDVEVAYQEVGEIKSGDLVDELALVKRIAAVGEDEGIVCAALWREGVLLEGLACLVVGLVGALQ